MIRYHCVSRNARGIKNFDLHFALPFKIKTICSVEGDIYFVSAASVGVAHKDGTTEYPLLGYYDENYSIDSYGVEARFNFPYGICYNPIAKTCYVSESQGRDIRKIDISSKHVSSLFKDNNAGNEIKKCFGKLSRANIVCPICMGDNGTIFWISSACNVGWRYQRSYLEKIIGNGSAGYSICSDIKKSMINDVVAMAYWNGIIYFIDSGNNCIRKIESDKISLFSKYGVEDKDNNLLRNPNMISISKSNLYILDNGIIKHYNVNLPSDKNFINVIEDGEIVAICSNADGGVSYIKELDAKEKDRK